MIEIESVSTGNFAGTAQRRVSEHGKFLFRMSAIEMAYDKREVNSEIVTSFLLNTCRLCPKPSKHNVHSARFFTEIATGRGRTVDDAEAHLIPLTTGSVAEFYIEPMLPHVGDIDVMSHYSTQLAIPRGQSPPTSRVSQLGRGI